MKVTNKVDRQWLKDLRKGKKLTVRALAEELGFSASYLSDIENSRRNPSVEKAYIMANFFDVDVSLFLTDRVRYSEKIH